MSLNQAGAARVAGAQSPLVARRAVRLERPAPQPFSRRGRLPAFAVAVGVELLLLLVVASPFAGQARAQQPSPAPASVEDANRLQQEGLALLSSDPAAALAKFLEALPIYRQAGVRLNEGIVLNSIGLAYERLERYAEASDAFRQARAIGLELQNPAVYGIATSGLARTTGAEGKEAETRGDYAQARTLYEAALSLARELDDPAEEELALSGLGGLARLLADYPRALNLYGQVLQLARDTQRTALAQGDSETLLQQRAAEFSALNDLGVIYGELSDFARALDSLTTARSILEELRAAAAAQGDDILVHILRRSQAVNESNIGEIYNRLGQPERALSAFETSLAIAREEGDRSTEGIALSNMASVYQARGENERALDLFQQALTIARALGERRDERILLNNLGSVYADLGDTARARDAYEQSLTIARQIGDRAGEQILLNNLGYLAVLQGQYADALDPLEQSLALARQVGLRSEEATALGNIGAVHEQLGNLDQALSFYEQAIAAGEDVRASARLEELKSSLAGTGSAAYYPVTVRLLLRLGRREEAFAMAERGRARAFLDQLGNTPLDVSRGSADLLTREQALRTEISTLDLRLRRDLAQSGGQALRAADQVLSDQLAAKQGEYAALLTQLRLSDPESATLVSVSPLSLGEIQAQLGPDETLLSYFITPDATVAFIVGRDRFDVVELPVTGPELRSAVEEFRRFADRTDPYPASLRQLYAWLVAPLRDRLTTPMVGVVPFGVLNYVPFAALTDGATYFGDEHLLFQVPSGSVLPFIAAKRKAERGAPLVVAQAVAEGLPPLRFADREAQAIADLFGVQPLIGRAATETAVKTQAGRSGLLHLAAHAELNAENPIFSRVFLDPDGQNDGSLTLQEVYGLNLRATDLVVLSACSTELGRRSEGDDIVSLSRAFVYAGTPTVVASLWEVNDLATSVLMTAFYRNLQSGMTKAEALQAAQAEVRTQFPSPFYWAAFVVTGDPG